MRENSVIVLIGPMGGGKSTVGRILASILGKQFLDSDEQIEKNAGASIPYIFEAEGEKGFRAREESTIRDLITGEGIVLATGGGAVLSANTRKLLKRDCFVVFLETSVGEQAQRTSKSDNRPLLRGQDRAEVLGSIYEKRKPLYEECADCRILTDGHSPREIAAFIAKEFRRV